MKLTRASARVSVEKVSLSIPGVTDYLSDIAATLENIEETLHAIRDALEAK